MLFEDRLAHLPAHKRRDLAQAAQILFEECDEAQKGKLTEARKRGRILKLILFGSHARGGWVEDRRSGYFSDYDLLLVVNDERLAGDFDTWDKARDRFIQHQMTKRFQTAPVSLIVHSLQDVNDQLARGRPFFVDIVREGIVLFEAEGHPFAEPGPLTEADRKIEAWNNFEEWSSEAGKRFKIAKFALSEDFRRQAAFDLHQVTEELFHCTLLTLTLYSPKLHALRQLRPIAEGVAPRLIEAWPRNTRFARRCFNLLHDAYVKARYSPHYAISREELAWLVERIEIMSQLVSEIGLDHLGRRPDGPE